MRIGVDVTIAPDNPRAPVVNEKVEIDLSQASAYAFVRGEYPMKLQIFLEAALPKLVKDAIREAAAR